MEPLNVENDFIEALEHSPFHLPEFLLHKQQQSGWSKKVYLGAMREVVVLRRIELDKLKQKAKQENSGFDASQFGQPLEEITGGKVKEYYAFGTHANSTLLNDDVL